MGAGFWGCAAVDLCFGVCGLAKPGKLVVISGMFQSLLLVPLGFAVLWLRYREGEARLQSGRVGCDVVDFVYQFCGHRLVFGYYQAGENFRLSLRPHGVE